MLLFGLFDHIVKQVASEVARQVTQAGKEVAMEASRKLMNEAVEIGKTQMQQGVKNLGRTVSLEMVKGNKDKLVTEVTRLAGQYNGELTVPIVMTAFDMPEAQAEKILRIMVTKDVCFAREGEDSTVFIFPGFKPRKTIKLCEYCDNRFDPKDMKEPDCPSCGAVLITADVYE